MTTAALSLFQHAGLAHLVGNLFALAIVGPRVAAAFGFWRFAGLFLIAGMVANYSAAALLERPVVGASGAVAAIMAAHLVLFPRSRIALLLILWIALQAVFGAIALDFAGVAWPAHVVGAALGVVLVLLARMARRPGAIARTQ